MATRVADRSATESEDLAAARLGDPEAFARLVRLYEPLITRHLRRFTGNETVLLDLRQETYLEIYRSLRTFRGQGRFSSWLRCIASRVGYRYWNRQARERQAKAAYVELRTRCASSNSVDQERDNREWAGSLLDTLGQLDRSIVEMKYLQDLNSAAIAACTGWHETRVRVRLHRALKKLRHSEKRSNATGL